MDIERSMVEYYARRAREFEQVYAKPERQADLGILRRGVEDYFAGTEGLEVACGTGYWTQYAARQATSWLATDINEGVLTIARTKPLDPARVRIERADIYQMPRTGRAFNSGLAAFWWSHVPRQRLTDFLQAFHAPLAPGARVWIMDNRFAKGSSTDLSRTDDAGNTYQRRSLADGGEFEVLKNFPSEEDLRSGLGSRAAEVRVEWLEYYWVLTYRVAA